MSLRIKIWGAVAALSVIVLSASYAMAQDKEWFDQDEEWKVENRQIELRAGQQITTGAGAGSLVVPQPELDVLETKVRDLAWGDVRRKRFEDAINELLGLIEFDFDKSNLDNEALTTIGKIKAKMDANEDFGFRLDGHTDLMGTEKYNMALSARRAESVRKKLIELGVDGAKLPTSFHGETLPLIAEVKPIRKNRRVEARVFDILKPLSEAK